MYYNASSFAAFCIIKLIIYVCNIYAAGKLYKSNSPGGIILLLIVHRLAILKISAK
jgi:hypothetical protein